MHGQLRKKKMSAAQKLRKKYYAWIVVEPETKPYRKHKDEIGSCQVGYAEFNFDYRIILLQSKTEIIHFFEKTIRKKKFSR